MTTKNAAIYARFSTSKQTTDSIDDQIRTCTEYARTNGLEIVATFSDEAASGAHSDRAAFNQMRAEAMRPARDRRFDVVLVADLSRLARDLFIMGRTVFEEFLPNGVTVIDRASGIASDNSRARQMFAITGIANDSFLQFVREKTHLGLTNRASTGHATGGRCYGYSTELDPTRTGTDRTRLVICEEQAAIVRRIFTLYRDGHGLHAIADVLNTDGIRAPYDGTPNANKTHGKGWAHTTVRAMLRNERYSGEIIWNKRTFKRVPGKKNRVAVMRPESEWVRTKNPELAIIDASTWSVVQAKLKTRASRAGRPLGAGGRNDRAPKLLAGVLTCGACGHAMGTVSAGKYGCLRKHSRGYRSAAGCSNTLAISTTQVEKAVVEELRALLIREDLWRPLLIQVMKRTYVAQFKEPEDLATLKNQLTTVENRVARLTEALADMGTSNALLAKLSEEEAQLDKLRAAIRERTMEAPSPTVTYEDLEGAFRRLVALSDNGDRTKANTALRAYLGKLVMTPKSEGPERGYRMSGAINLFVPLQTERENVSCGGRI